MGLSLPSLNCSIDKLQAVSEFFCQQIIEAREAGVSSLEFDKTALNLSGEVFSDSNSGLSQVLYIGATHIESALIKKDRSGKERITEFSSQEIEVIRSQKDFLELIEKYLKTGVYRLHLNLAAHLKSITRNGLVDGVLVKNHRQHNLQELVDKPLGKVVEEHFEVNFGRKIYVGGRNNLVSLGLLARQKKVYKSCQTLVGIVASGVNFGFFENEKFVNLESGKLELPKVDLATIKLAQKNLKFGYFSQNEANLDVFQSNKVQSITQISELIGESYLWENYNKIIQELNLDLQPLSDRLAFRKALESQNSLEKDLAWQILEQSAQLTAAKIAGLIQYKKISDKNFNPTKINFLLEGSLFWEVNGYRQLVEKTLQDLGLAKESIRFIRIQFGFIFGALAQLQLPTFVIRRRVRFEVKVRSLLRGYQFQLRGPPNKVSVYSF